MSDVRTRWHDFMEAVEAGHLIFRVANGATRRARAYRTFDYGQLLKVIQKINEVPKFFFTNEVVDMIGTKSTSDTIEALQQFKLDRLPNDCNLVEFQGDVTDHVRHFVLAMHRDVMEAALPKEVMWHPFTTVLFSLYQPGVIKSVSGDVSGTIIERDKPYAVIYPIHVNVQHVGKDYDFASDHITEYKADVSKVEEIGGIHNYFIYSPYVKSHEFKPEEIKYSQEYLAGLVGIATRGLVALLRTKGVERAEIAVPKLNKLRKAKGRVSIPDHTVVRFGHYYKSDGKRGTIDPNAPRGKVRMHVRSAHTKMQPYGALNAQRKLIMVEACLVNYDPATGEAPPIVKRKVVKA